MSLQTELAALALKVGLLEAELSAQAATIVLQLAEIESLHAQLEECEDGETPPVPDPEPDPDPEPEPEPPPPAGMWPISIPATLLKKVPPLPTATVTFNSNNRYTDDKIKNAPAGSVFRFTGTGSAAGNEVYPVTIPFRNGDKAIFDPVTLLQGGFSRSVAVNPAATDLSLWGIRFTGYTGQDSGGSPNKKGAGALLMGARWMVYNPEGFGNKYMAIRWKGVGSFVVGGSIHDNHQYGFGGTGNGGGIHGVKVYRNGDGATINVDNDRGGSKINNTDGFQWYGNEMFENQWNAAWGDINNINHRYAYNWIHDNFGAGIQHEVSFKAEIDHNYLVDNWRKLGTLPTDAKKAAIQTSMSPDVHIHDNHIEGAYYGVSAFNQGHMQWKNPIAWKGCLGVRNLLVENNTIIMRDLGSKKWIAAAALFGNIPDDRLPVHKCGQKPAVDRASNNRFVNNTVTISGGLNPKTPYVLGGQLVAESVFTTATKP